MTEQQLLRKFQKLEYGGFGNDFVGLSFTLEEYGKEEYANIHGRVFTLMTYMIHDEPIVREGALLGLGRMNKIPVEAVPLIRKIAQADKSPSVRETASYLLDSYYDESN